jgi:hypothetical protein
MSARQGSASFTVVIGGLAALVVGAIVLTFVMFPVTNSFTDAAFWSASTTGGARLLGVVEGVWTFSGAVMLMTTLSWIWVRTRQ